MSTTVSQGIYDQNIIRNMQGTIYWRVLQDDCCSF